MFGKVEIAQGSSWIAYAMLAWLLFFSTALPANAASSLWMDPTLAAEQRANLLLDAMSLDDKIAMVHGVSGPYVGNTAGIGHLGIPALHLSDGPAGVADGIHDVTALPAPILLAATWDKARAREYGQIIGAESRGKGVHISLGPMINLVRVPQGGRDFETYGEEPFLTGAMAVEDILGIQSQGVVANAKHFICNDQENARGNVNVHVDDRTLNEIYFPPFLASVRAGVGSICAAYNAVNGPWSAESPMLKNVLKDNWGFDGFIECDWGGNFDMQEAVTNGLDLEMPLGARFDSPLKSAVQSGIVPVSQLDTMVRRILIPLFRFGIFDNPTTGNINSPVTTPEHALFARNAAVQGMVLLKNSNGMLPLDTSSIGSIAVIGTAASANPIYVGGGSALVYLPYYNDPLTGISNRAGTGIAISYTQGDGGGSLQQAVQAARQADVAIVCVGQQTGEGNDRIGFSLPPDQDDLVSAIASANSRTIVVMYEGAGTLMPWIDQVGAVLLAWYPGQENGNAVASILFGDANPSGKLPVTFPASSNQVPASAAWQYPGTNLEMFYAEGIFMGYRWYDASNASPLFPFGFGLSYTTFQYANLIVSGVNPAGQVTVECDVQNTGGRSGSEIAQLYLGFPAIAGEPPRQLKGFEKVFLPPGAVGHVTFHLNWEDLAYWDPSTNARTVPVGTFQVMVGASSRDIRLNGSFPVTTAIPTSGAANRALFHTVVTSSTAAAGPGSAAVDGDPATAWVSNAEGSQWLAVDLGTVRDLARARLKWGVSYALDYEIQISNDGNTWVSIYSTTGGNGGTEDIVLSGSSRYVRLFASFGVSSEYSLAEFEIYSPQPITTLPILPDGVWFEDSLPVGAVPALDSDSWNWVSNNPAPFSGQLALQSRIAPGFHQQYFSGATSTLVVHTNDTLFAYVYLDPANAPSEIMLQWNAGNWEHRAFWGDDNISLGTPGTGGHRYMGAMPATGQWIRLTVPARQVDLEGATLTGMAFSLYDGRATWDRAGRSGANLAVVNLTLSSAGAMLDWVSSVGAVYRVNYKSNLGDSVWINGSGDFTATSTTSSWLDTSAPTGGQRFYQVIQAQ